MKLLENIKKIKNIKGITFISVGLICGILCIVLSESSGSGPQSTETDISEHSESTLAEYKEAEESRVSALLNAIDGVRSARVMLTFESGSEYVYEASNYSGRTPLLLQEHPPKVSGAAVVCVGGGNADIQMKVIDLVCSLYGISSSRVSVAGAS